MMSIYSGVCRIYTPRHLVHLHYPCISVHPPSILNDVLGGHGRPSLEMHLETEIEWTQRCTFRPGSSEFRDAFGDRDRVNSNMQFEAGIERVWRCMWRPRMCELRDALGGCDRASLEMHLEAMIERDWRSTWRRSIWRRKFGREARQELRLYSLVNSELWECGASSTPAEWWEIAWEWETVNHGMMQYSVYAVLGVNSSSCH